MRTQTGVALIECAAERWLRLVQRPAHADVLRALSREEKSDPWHVRSIECAGMRACGRCAVEELTKPVGDVLSRGTANCQAVWHLGPACIRCKRDIGQ